MPQAGQAVVVVGGGGRSGGGCGSGGDHQAAVAVAQSLRSPTPTAVNVAGELPEAIFDPELKGSGLHFLVEFGGATALETSARPHRALGGGQEDRLLDRVGPLAKQRGAIPVFQAKGRDPGSGFQPRVGPPVDELQGEGEPGFWPSLTAGPLCAIPGFGPSTTNG